MVDIKIMPALDAIKVKNNLQFRKVVAVKTVELPGRNCYGKGGLFPLG